MKRPAPKDLSETIHLLGDVLGQVIIEQESKAAFDLEERIRGFAKARRAGDERGAHNLQAEVSGLEPDAAAQVRTVDPKAHKTAIRLRAGIRFLSKGMNVSLSLSYSISYSPPGSISAFPGTMSGFGSSG